MPAIYLERSDPSVKAIIEATFPEYNGKNISCTVTDKIHFCNTQWDAGYMRTYKILRMADMQIVEIERAPFLRDSALHSQSHIIPDGFVVVVFVNGRRDGIEIHSPSINIVKSLTVDVPLTDDEMTVLIATRSLKSSYAGIPNFRFKEANRARGITSEQWDIATATLKQKGLLNKAGAITIKGKNIVGWKNL